MTTQSEASGDAVAGTVRLMPVTRWRRAGEADGMEACGIDEGRPCRRPHQDLCLLVLSHELSHVRAPMEAALNADGMRVRELSGPLADTDFLAPSPVFSLSVQDARGNLHHGVVDGAAASRRVPWIAGRLLGQRFLLVSAFAKPDTTPCVTCATISAKEWMRERTPGTLANPRFSAAQTAFTVAVMTKAVADLIERRREEIAGQHASAVLYDLVAMSSVDLPLGRMPECPRCWPATEDTGLGEPQMVLPAMFEECARTRSEAADHGTLGRRLTRNMALAQPRSYPHSSRVQLPPWSALYRDRHQRKDGQLSLEEISAVLFLTFGRWNAATAKRPDRVLPSAGNLGSPGAFLITCGAAGIEKGVYAYLEDVHQLARIHPASAGVAEEILSGFSDKAVEAVPGVLLVVAGAYLRIGQKYGAFGYRLVHFDAGLFTAHLRAVAESLSLVTQEMEQWPDKMLAKRLGIRPHESPIVAAITLSARGADRFPAPEVTSQPSPGAAVISNVTPSRRRQACTAGVLAKRIQRSSRAEALSGWLEATDERRDGCSADAASCFCAPRTHAELWDELLTRQSVRAFEDAPVSLSQLEAILRETERSMRLHGSGPAIKVLATARTGSFQEPQWKTYELSGKSRIMLYGVPAFFGVLEELFVHPPPARAPVVFWICGDVRQTAWRYRRMLLEAGRQAYGLTQQAACFGLQGVLVGGIWPQRVSSLLGLRFCDESPLLAFACGRAQLGSPGE